MKNHFFSVDSSIDKRAIGTIISNIAITKGISKTIPRNKTLNTADDNGSLAPTTDTIKGDTKEAAFIEIKKEKAVPKRAMIMEIAILKPSNLNGTW